MANRREILQAGLAISVAPLWRATTLLFSDAPPADQVAPPNAEKPPQTFMVDGLVFDNRFAESVEASRTAARCGATLHEIDGDVTDFWYHHLDFRWRGKHGALAGVTGDDALFVFENLAWDRRLRVVYRGRHASSRNGVVEHVLSGPVSVVDGMDVSVQAGPWPHLVGSSLARWSGRREPSKTIQLKSADEVEPERRAVLMSWIVAPSSWELDRV